MGAMAVDDDDEILLINSDGIIIRMAAKEISKLGRATQGVKIMNVGEDANIIALAKVIKEDELDGESEKNADRCQREGVRRQMQTAEEALIFAANHLGVTQEGRS